MKSLFKILINLLSIVVITPLFFLNATVTGFKLRYKKNIFIYHHGWGVGHTLHDIDLYRKRFESNDTAMIFFNDGKHNTYLTEASKDIKILFINIFFNIPFFKSKIQIRRSISKMFFNMFYLILKIIFNKNKFIRTFDEYKEELKSKYSFNDDQFIKLLEPSYEYYLESERQGIVMPDKIKKEIEKSLKRKKINLEDKIIAIYVRYKGNDKAEHKEFLRSSSIFSNYFPVFNYLINKKFTIFLYGDYEYSQLVKYSNHRKIITHEMLEIDKSVHCLYASLKCDYFICNSGGGTHFPFARKNPPKTLVINAMPFNYCLPFATVVYKSVKMKDGSLLDGRTIIENYSSNYLIDDCEIEENSKDLMLDSVIEFLEFSEKGCSNKELNTKISAKGSTNNNIYNKYRSRISPIWYDYNSKI